MDPISQEQTATLEGFTQQRDRLVSEISELTRQNDTLTAINTDLGTQNHVLASEIADNKLKLAVQRETVDLHLEKIENDRINGEKELSITLQKKSEAATELQSLLLSLSSVRELVRSTLADAYALTENFKTLEKSVFDNVNTIANGAAEVVRVNTVTKNAVEEFHNKIISSQLDNEKRKMELDSRERVLDSRDVAFDSTYGSILKIMERDGLQLTELKPVV